MLTGYYSKNYDNLEMVIPPTPNNNTGGGLCKYPHISRPEVLPLTFFDADHFGIIKLPASGTGNGSVPFSGYQPPFIEEVRVVALSSMS